MARQLRVGCFLSKQRGTMAQYVSARRSFNGLTRVDMEDYFDDMEIENLYQWIDRIPLTRPKKNLAKDFSDGGKSDL